MDVSKFVLRSIGIAAENKALSSNLLEVYPIETLPFADGEITNFMDNHHVTGIDGSGNAYSVQLNTANSLSATWLQWGSNRLTAPDIRRGERVLIYQFGDSDQYYWVTTGLDDNLRRLETVIFAISATPDESVRTLTPDNTYSMEWSSHKKNITLKTSKANGEPFAYTLQLDLANGNLIFADDVGNFIQLDSANHAITMKNQDGSMIAAVQRNIFEQCADSYNLQCKTMNVNADSAINVTTQTYTEQVQNLTTTASDKITATAQEIDTTAPAFNQTGPINVSLVATVGGLAAGGGGSPAVSISGSTMAITVPTTTTSTIHNNGVPIDATHTHVSASPGALTSTPQ